MSKPVYASGIPFTATTSPTTLLITTYVNSFYIVNNGSESITYVIYGSPDGIKTGDKDNVGNVYSETEIAKHWIQVLTENVTTKKSISVSAYPYNYFKVVVYTSSGTSTGNIWTNTISKSVVGIADKSPTSLEIAGDVVSYADLPLASQHNGELWLVLTSTGSFFLRKEKGLYFSNGSSWTWMSDYQILYDDSSTTFYDDGDNTKRAQFQLNGISPNNTRIITFPDKDITLAGINDPIKTAGVSQIPTIGYTLGLGQVTISSFKVFLHQAAGWNTDIREYTIPAISPTLAANAYSYLIASYNSGNPIASITTNPADINSSDVLLIAHLYWESQVSPAEDHVHYFIPPIDAYGKPNKITNRLINTNRYERSSGLLISEVGTRNIASTLGIVWYADSSVSISALNTSTGDRIHFYYHLGGVWTVDSSITQYNNTQYDNGTNLATLSSNRYAVNWIYRSMNDAEFFILLGSGDYKLNEALNSQPPSMPTIITRQSLLIGRIIVQEGESTATIVQSAFGTVFSPGTANHNDLMNIQGGSIDERYHLSLAQYDSVDNKLPYHGFETTAGSTISFSYPTFSLNYVSTYNTYVYGVKINHTTTKTCDITDVSGLWYISMNSTGTISASQTVWSILDITSIPVAVIWWDSINAAYRLSEERHSYDSPLRWHDWAHDTIGSRYQNGFTGTFTGNAISITSGSIHDEDLHNSTSYTLTSATRIYRGSGGNGQVFTDTPVTSFTQNGNLYWDNNGTLTEITTNGQYAVYYFYGTNDKTNTTNTTANTQIYMVVGQASYASAAAARAAALPVINLSTAEWKILYRVIYYRTGGNVTYLEEQDLRAVSTGPAIQTPSASQNASQISTDTSGFNNILTASETNVQLALDKIDNSAVTFLTAQIFL